MKHGPVYTVIFMFVITVIFTGALAFTDNLSANKIEINAELENKKAILSSLGINYGDTAASIEKAFSDNIIADTVNGIQVYEETGADKTLKAYAVYVTGPGLWGTISGYVAVSADLRTLIGIEFTQQNETPGLGGRITEDRFKEQFRGVDISRGSALSYGNGIDAITGATLTSGAVMKIVNTFIREKLSGLEAAN